MPHPGLPERLPADFVSALAQLGEAERIGVEEMKLLILLEMAGEPLYGKLAELAGNEESREILLKNGREETAHAHRLKKAIEILTGEEFEIPPMSDNPYAVAPPLTELSVEVLRGLEEGEKRGGVDYERMAEAETNAEVAELLRQNGREEVKHGERVSTVIDLLG
ncbi:MAG: ferritin-like domain-containing protein [Myxococcota bacterium]|jgi:rubrerythrin|nr:ferritin-like domain-containing protein [Myxococcota bacterium]